MTNPHALVASRYLLFCSLAAECILKSLCKSYSSWGFFTHINLCSGYNLFERYAYSVSALRNDFTPHKNGLLKPIYVVRNPKKGCCLKFNGTLWMNSYAFDIPYGK
jgi:hypothetical protein